MGSQKNNSNMQKISLLLSPLLISAVPPKPLRDRPGRIVILGEKCPSVVGTTKFRVGGRSDFCPTLRHFWAVFGQNFQKVTPNFCQKVQKGQKRPLYFRILENLSS